MRNEAPVRYGNVGIMARIVFENFELCLMLIAAYILGSIVAPVTATIFGVEISIITTVLMTSGIALIIVGTHIIDRELFGFSLIEHLYPR